MSASPLASSSLKRAERSASAEASAAAAASDSETCPYKCVVMVEEATSKRT